MKKVSILLMLLLSVTAFSQTKPQKVYSIVKEVREESWYKEQAKLWKAEIDKNNQNAEAWYYYYVAIRSLKNTCEWHSGEWNSYYEQASKIANNAYKAIPNTFEGNHLVWYQSDNNLEKLPFLLKAYEINPNDSRCYVDLLTHYAIIFNKEKYNLFCNKFYKANEIPAPLYNWAYNMLIELDENAIVFTAGDNDTYSPWILQVVKGIRPDVHVINTYLLAKYDYRMKLFNELGLDVFDKKVEDGKTELDQVKIMHEIYDHIFENNKNIPVYVSSTAMSQFQNNYSENLYLTGLSYKYSKKNIDNISLIRRNYEKRYLLDYLTIGFSFNMANNKAHQINATYLPAFVKLYKHYQETEEIEKMNILKRYIIEISKKSGQETEISELLGAESSAPNDFNSILLSTKKLEKQFVKLYDEIYMNKYEVSNVEYQKFLSGLLSSRNIELFKTCLYDSLSWTEAYKFYVDPMKNMYHWHPAYDNYPIVNITHYAAKMYCEWLTVQYNSQNKRNFTKVVFRLPTENEWEYAAGNGQKNVKTSFKDDKVKNDDCECYLANLKYQSVEDGTKFYDDGGFFMVKSDSYNPNKLGLYNMIGNVAEMIDEDEISKGGSWNSFLKDSYIPLNINYTKPNPETGFRIVMEVIKE